ncbi:MAG TPA: aminoglycoside phosphotransferase family protein [Acidimicrobiia bacterium]
MHDDQLEVTTPIVTALIRDQFPAWATLPVTSVDSEGTVNAIFRIGDNLVGRFPLQTGDVDEVRAWLQKEARAERELGDHTQFRIPEPVAIGKPGDGYPLPWAVQTWLPGVTVSRQDQSGSFDFARDLATFVGELAAIEVGDRVFAGEGRGGDLQSHDEWIEICLSNIEPPLDTSHLGEMWAYFRELPRESSDAMTHGDLVPGNLLVSGGHLAGVLDVGGLGPADPSLDLVGAWHMLDSAPRQLFRDHLGCEPLDWERGKAWAFQQAMGVVWYYRTSNPPMSRMGFTTLSRLGADKNTPLR